MLKSAGIWQFLLLTYYYYCSAVVFISPTKWSGPYKRDQVISAKCPQLYHRVLIRVIIYHHSYIHFVAMHFPCKGNCRHCCCLMSHSETLQCTKVHFASVSECKKIACDFVFSFFFFLSCHLFKMLIASCIDTKADN